MEISAAAGRSFLNGTGFKVRISHRDMNHWSERSPGSVITAIDPEKEKFYMRLKSIIMSAMMIESKMFYEIYSNRTTFPAAIFLVC